MVSMIMCPSVNKLTQLIQLRADRHLSLKLFLMKSETSVEKMFGMCRLKMVMGLVLITGIIHCSAGKCIVHV